MNTYARYIYNMAFDLATFGKGWHKVVREYNQRTPGGFKTFLILDNGKAIKADRCEIIQVIE